VLLGAIFDYRELAVKLSSRLVSLLIILAVFLSMLLARRLGWLQFLEFRAYDFFIQQQPKAASSSPIILVEMTEQDIQSPTLDYPITDDKLAELLNILEAQQPSVIGLDIWRDIPVPKNGAHLQQLNDVLLAHTNIIAIFTLGGIVPPAALASSPERLGFNDNLPVDDRVDKTTPKVRRGLLIGDSPSGQSFDSIAFRLAEVYLERRGIEPQFDPADPNSFQLGKTRLRALEANDGAYVGADSRGWQMLLDFKCPDQFVRYSVEDALRGRIPSGNLRDAIVLVGMNAPSVSDERVTPIRFNHHGIEVQAQIIHQLLRAALNGERPLRFWTDWQEDTWMLLWCLIGGAIGYWLRSPWRFITAIVLALLALGWIAWWSFLAGWWIPLMAPSVACLPAAALVTSYISFEERKQRSQLMQLFSNQVSPDIAQALWEQRDEFLAGNRPRSQKLTATVLFTDLKGFSATSEGLEPARLMDWLNEYMEAMAKAVMAEEGVVEKYIGDSIMAVFGVPLVRTTQVQIAHDARNAVRCALAMQKEMERLNAEWKQRNMPVCSMRIGIHTGPLVAGSLGSVERQEYTVIGDAVNTASRLESFDKDSDPADSVCRILISEATKVLLDDEFELSLLGTMSLKNKSEKVIIHRVVGRTNREPGGRRDD
jgi:adenylate cyclase